MMAVWWFRLLVATVCLCSTTHATREYNEFSELRLRLLDTLVKTQETRDNNNVQPDNVRGAMIAVRAKPTLFEKLLFRFREEVAGFPTSYIRWPVTAKNILLDIARPGRVLTNVTLVGKEFGDEARQAKVELLPSTKDCESRVRLIQPGITTYFKATLIDNGGSSTQKKNLLIIMKDTTLILEASPENLPFRDMNVQCKAWSKSDYASVGIVEYDETRECAFTYPDEVPRGLQETHYCYIAGGQFCCNPRYSINRSYLYTTSMLRRKLLCEPIERIAKMFIIQPGWRYLDISQEIGYAISYSHPIVVTKEIVEIKLEVSVVTRFGQPPPNNTYSVKFTPIPPYSSDDGKMLNLYVTDDFVNVVIQGIRASKDSGPVRMPARILEPFFPELRSALSMTCAPDEACLGKVFPKASSRYATVSFDAIVIPGQPIVRFSTCDVRVALDATIMLRMDEDNVGINVTSTVTFSSAIMNGKIVINVRDATLFVKADESKLAADERPVESALTELNTRLSNALSYELNVVTGIVSPDLDHLFRPVKLFNSHVTFSEGVITAETDFA